MTARKLDSSIRLRLDFPTNLCICGGSGKTNETLDILTGTRFERVVLCVGQGDEPLYVFFISSMRKYEKATGLDLLTVVNSLKDIPDIKTFKESHNNCIVIDTFENCNKEDTIPSNIYDLFTEGNKRNITILCVSENSQKLPEIFHDNMSLLRLK